MPIHPDILQWSQERPLWQRDALRRMADTPILNSDDIQELVELCLHEFGLPKRIEVEAVPLNTTHCGEVAVNSIDVTLRSVGGLKHVNALLSSETLQIAAEGITVVYGDNGAGKSGYVRLLKQFCRARGGRDNIHPNIYDQSTGSAEATLQYAINGSEATLHWGVGVPLPSTLSQVSIFDSKSAAIYVTQENDVAYLPYGMDLFPRLVDVTDRVRLELEQELSRIEARKDRFDTIDPTTLVAEILQNLHTSNARERVDELITLTETDHEQLVELREQERRMNSDDPAIRAKQYRLCAERLQLAEQKIASLETALAVSTLANVKNAREAVVAAHSAADLASKAFADMPIAGVGSSPWRDLWEAARRFVLQSSDQDAVFPPPSGERCVLCQEPLSDDAAQRMAKFEEFVKAETSIAVARSEERFNEHITTLNDLKTSGIADTELLKEIQLFDSELEAILKDCITRLEQRRIAIINAESKEDWDAVPMLEPSPGARLQTLCEKILREAIDFEAAADPEALRVVKRARCELEARIVLTSLKDRVYAEIDRLVQRDILKRCITSANTTGITRKNTEMLAATVTQPLIDEFGRQIQALNLSKLPISVEPVRGAKGRTFHTINLNHQRAKAVPINEILSEGEHRCTALAAFFAEIELQESKSTIIFDDPVSSLDHGRRQYIAERIVAIAATRPVVVFTHDIAFLYVLNATAAERTIPMTPRYLVQEKNGAGKVYDDWPFQGLPVKQRIGLLRSEVQCLKALAESDRKAYSSSVKDFYADLRSTWERAVEEALLNGAVTRFGGAVQTKRLARLHVVSEQQLLELEAAMTRTSKLIRGHDHAPELQVTTPEPNELHDDVEKLAAWVKEMNKIYN